MPAELPLEPSVPDYSFSTVLDGAVFELRVRWNSRDLAWYMDLFDDAGVVIRFGIKLVLASTLGRSCVDPRFPAGLFQLVDTSGADVDAGFDDMGTRVKLVFYTWTELEAFAALAGVEL